MSIRFCQTLCLRHKQIDQIWEAGPWGWQAKKLRCWRDSKSPCTSLPVGCQLISRPSRFSVSNSESSTLVIPRIVAVLKVQELAKKAFQKKVPKSMAKKGQKSGHVLSTRLLVWVTHAFSAIQRGQPCCNLPWLYPTLHSLGPWAPFHRGAVAKKKGQIFWEAKAEENETLIFSKICQHDL